MLSEDLADLIEINIERIQAGSSPTMERLARGGGSLRSQEDIAKLDRLVKEGRETGPDLEDAENAYNRAFGLIADYIAARRTGQTVRDLARIEGRMEKPKSLLSGAQRSAFEQALRVAKANSDQEAWDVTSAPISQRHADLIFRLSVHARDTCDDSSAARAISRVFEDVLRIVDSDREMALRNIVQTESNLRATMTEWELPDAVMERFKEAVYIAKQAEFTDIETARKAVGREHGGR